MKLTALAVVLLALGIVLGLALRDSAFDSPASADPTCPGPSANCPTPTPEPPQQREDQITIWSRPDTAGGTVESAEFERISPNEIALDSAEYPPASTFSLEVVIGDGLNSTNCVRLYDLTINEPVPGSDLWIARGPSGVSDRFRSNPFSLQAGEHDYTLQGMRTNVGASVNLKAFAARIIVEWTE